MYRKTYVQACLDGEATIFDLDAYIDFWHENDLDMTLREFLGLTPYEYEEWGKNNNSIFRDIMRCRVEGIDFSEYVRMSEEERKAARCYDAEKVELLKKAYDE